MSDFLRINHLYCDINKCSERLEGKFFGGTLNQFVKIITREVFIIKGVDKERGYSKISENWKATMAGPCGKKKWYFMLKNMYI